MPQSLSFLLVHVIFSTKERKPLLESSMRPELYAYLSTVIRNAGCEGFRVGGTEDHIHLAVRLSRTKSVADLMEELKSASSKWLKSKGLADFSWQKGYGAFSVGPTDLEALIRYIDTQEEHHKKQDFQAEFRAFLKRYGVEYDERYVWD